MTTTNGTMNGGEDLVEGGVPIVAMIADVTGLSKTGNDVMDQDGKMGPPLPPKAKRKCWTSRNKYLLSALLLPEERLPKGSIKKKADKGGVVGKGKASEDTLKTSRTEVNYTCDLCNGVFTSSSNLQKHRRIHTGERQFECSICQKRFATKFALERHRIAHDPNGSKAVQICNICDKRFSTKEWLIIHVRSHTGEMPFKCDNCDKRFTSQSSLNRHVLTHSNSKRFLCYECGKMYQSSQAMRIHLESHVTERNFHCGKCRMRFKRALDLQRHGLTHREVQMLPCPLPSCEHQFRRKDNLLRHLQLTHDQTREEAHETFNLLDTSCKTSVYSDSINDSAPNSVSAISDAISEGATTPFSTDDNETQDSCRDKTIRKNANKKKTRRNIKNSQRSMRKNAQRTKRPRKQQQLPQVKTSTLSTEFPVPQDIPNEAQMRGTKYLPSIDDSELDVPPSTTSRSAVVSASPKKISHTSVTTSVIRMAKSSSQTTSHHHHSSSRKRHKRSHDHNEGVGREYQRPQTPPTPSMQTLPIPIPYPSRNISPGQEYINYLNNLNNPIEFRVRDRSSSFRQHQHPYNNDTNSSSYIRSEPQPRKYSDPEIYYSSKPNHNQTYPNSSNISVQNQNYNDSDVEIPENTSLNFVVNDYDSSSGYFHQPQHQTDQPEFDNNVRYMDLSVSHPDFNDRNIMHQSYADNYGQQFLEDLSSHHIPGDKESPPLYRIVSNYIEDGDYYSSSSGYNYQSSLPGPAEAYPNPIPASIFQTQGESCERPFNVTVIKRASTSQNQNNGLFESRDPRNFTQSSIHTDNLEFSQSCGIGTSAVDETIQNRGNKTHHHQGDKDMIVNRDPRKNFLQREFLKN